MTEFIKERLYPMTVAYKCDACEDGEMIHISTGMLTSSYPAQYPHKCNKCEHQSNFHECYPKVKYMTRDELNQFKVEK